VQNNTPAMAAVILSTGEVTYIDGFRYMDQAELKPTTEKSLFRIASVSQLFTAQAI
jgi:CubicO group peptidase (beta-lactamase class C family)